MTHGVTLTRRRVLAAVGISTLAGCAGGTTGTTRTGSPPGSPSTSTATADDLDLREANVTGVSITPSEGGYRFDVTLYHDDDGEDGYADWWQVETRDGTRVGRRELLHAHGTREFTRSATIEVPDGIECVVVRGHDQTHGYGGQAMLVTPSSEATRTLRQGPEPRSFAGTACP